MLSFIGGLCYNIPMKNVSFICPVCGQTLTRGEKSYTCAAGHCFDIARQSYVNLITGSSKGRHGDDRLMVRARRDFLEKGWYNRLASEIAQGAVRYAPDDCAILDAGCGEGKYTLDVLNALTGNGKRAKMIGVDISKDALIYAAKRSDKLQLAAASTAALPLGDGSVDMVLNVFSPFMAGEFRRVLVEGGTLIRVIPLERHLWELKELIYAQPYENTVGDLSAEGFAETERQRVAYPVTLETNADIMELFRMTPYYYKTGREDQARAEAAQKLDVSLEFGIIIYKKI